MIQFDLKQKELDRALHDERERTIKKLVSDPEYFKRLSTDTGVRREVADALNAERKLSNLVWSLVRICYSGDAVKVVEAICQELPSASRMVFLHNVVIVCRHPGSSLRNDPHGRRVAAFASGMRRHLSKQAPSSSYLKQLPTKKQVLRLIESCGSPGARLAVALAAFSGLDRGQIRELVFQNLVEFSAGPTISSGSMPFFDSLCLVLSCFSLIFTLVPLYQLSHEFRGVESTPVGFEPLHFLCATGCGEVRRDLNLVRFKSS